MFQLPQRHRWTTELIITFYWWPNQIRINRIQVSLNLGVCKLVSQIILPLLLTVKRMSRIRLHSLTRTLRKITRLTITNRLKIKKMLRYLERAWMMRHRSRMSSTHILSHTRQASNSLAEAMEDSSQVEQLALLQELRQNILPSWLQQLMTKEGLILKEMEEINCQARLLVNVVAGLEALLPKIRKVHLKNLLGRTETLI